MSGAPIQDGTPDPIAGDLQTAPARQPQSILPTGGTIPTPKPPATPAPETQPPVAEIPTPQPKPAPPQAPVAPPIIQALPAIPTHDKDDPSLDYVKSAASNEDADLLREHYENLDAPPKPEEPKPATGAEEPSEEEGPMGVGEAITTGAPSVLGDIGFGLLVESPGAILSGLRNDVNEFTKVLDSAGAATAEGIASGVGDEATRANIEKARAKGEQFLGDKVPELDVGGVAGFPSFADKLNILGKTVPSAKAGPGPTTVTGAAVESIAQFIGPFKALGKTFKAAEGIEAVAKGAISKKGAKNLGDAVNSVMTDALFFDKTDANLFNVFDHFPGTQNFISDFLRTDPNDSEAYARMKRGIVNIAGNKVLEVGFFEALKVYRRLRWTKTKIKPKATGPTVSLEDLHILGDPMAHADDPLVRVGGVPGSEADLAMLGKDEFGPETARQFADALTGSRIDASMRIIREPLPSQKYLIEKAASGKTTIVDTDDGGTALLQRIGDDKGGKWAVTVRNKAGEAQPILRFDTAEEATRHLTNISTEAGDPLFHDIYKTKQRIKELDAKMAAEDKASGATKTTSKPSASPQLDTNAARSARAKAESEWSNSGTAESVDDPSGYGEFKTVMRESGADDVPFEKYQVRGTHSEEEVAQVLGEGKPSNRSFDSGPVKPGTYGVDTTRVTSPYLLVSSDEFANGRAVVLNGPAKATADELRKAFPNANIYTAEEFAALVKSGKPVPQPGDVVRFKTAERSFDERMRAQYTTEVADLQKQYAASVADPRGGMELNDLWKSYEGEGGAADESLKKLEDVQARLRVRSAFEPRTFGVPKRLAPGEIAVNWAGISEDGDVTKIMQQMTEVFSKDLDAARRGVVSWERSIKDSGKVDAFKMLTERRRGQALNDAELLAGKALFEASGNKLHELTTRIKATGGTDADLYAFTKMIAVHKAIQEKYLGAVSEAGRALNILKTPAGSSAGRAKQIGEILDKWGGKSATRELAAKLAAADDVQLNHIIEHSFLGSGSEAFKKHLIAGLLWKPATHLVNVFGSSQMALQSAMEHGFAATLGEARVGGTTIGASGADRVAAGEGMSQVVAIINAIPKAWQYAKKAAWSGESQFGRQHVETRGAPIADFLKRLPYVRGSGPLGKVAEYIDGAIGLSNRALGGEDEFYKALGYNAGISTQAQRIVEKEVRMGKITREQALQRFEQLREAPSDEMIDAANDYARYVTFTSEPGELTRDIMNMAQRVAFLRPFVMPFINTPANIMKRTFERTPLAPLMKSVREELAAGGARADLAEARIMMGTMQIMYGADLAMKGQLVGYGPTDPAERQNFNRMGGSSYSMNAFGKWWPLAPTPLGTNLGMGADLAHGMTMMEFNEDDQTAAVEASIGAVASTLGSVAKRSFMGEMMDLTSFLNNSMHGETNEGGVLEQMGDIAGKIPNPLVPTTWVPSSLLRSIEQSVDPEARVAQMRSSDEEIAWGQEMIYGFRKSIPGASHQYQQKFDLWGRPVFSGQGNGIYDVFVPFLPKMTKVEPIDKEMKDIGAFIREPTKDISLSARDMQVLLGEPVPHAVKVSLKRFPGVHQQFIKRAGDGVTLPQYGEKTAREFLNDVVTGQDDHWSDIYESLSSDPKGELQSKVGFIRKVVGEYRDAALRELVENNEEIAKEFRKGAIDVRHYYEEE